MYTNENIYILELNGGHYYIGKTNNIDRRFNDHKTGKGSNWTRLHGGCKIIEIHPNENLFDEDKHTLDYMNMMGIDKVRGGSYSNIILTDEQKSVIMTSIRNANNQCIECGGSNHFAMNCPARILLPSLVVESITENKAVKPVVMPPTVDPSNLTCTRCLRKGHIVTKCYAATTLSGKYIGKNEK